MLYTTSACAAIFLCATLTHVTAQSNRDPLCPYPSDDFTFYPNPADCSQYFQCYDGIKTLMQCPLNFLWNTVQGYCDLPNNVDCTRNTDPTAAPITTPTTPTPPTTTPTTTTFNPNATTTPTAATGYTPDPLCPYPSETLIFYPYPEDCNRYYECFEGRRYLMNCPAKLYWNAARQACDWPENVYCAVSTTTGATTSPGPTTTAVTTSPVPTTPFIPDPSCPYPSDDFTYFPDDKDCTQYYECYQGRKQLKKCPANFFWNTETNYCDYITNVDCTKNFEPTTVSSASTASTAPVTTVTTPTTIITTTTVTSAPDTTTTAATTPTTQTTPPTPQTTPPTPQTTTPTLPPTTSTPSTTPVSLCYRHPDGTFLSDPDDCSKYIECNLGHEVIGQCPDGLLWHETITSCDFPDHVNC